VRVPWENRQAGVKELGGMLLLDSGALKRLESQGLISRTRNGEDERKVSVGITETGMALRERALKIPKRMTARLTLSAEDV
jgi:DNA-binding MarR family transcriptional regulator